MPPGDCRSGAARVPPRGRVPSSPNAAQRSTGTGWVPSSPRGSTGAARLQGPARCQLGSGPDRASRACAGKNADNDPYDKLPRASWGSRTRRSYPGNVPTRSRARPIRAVIGQRGRGPRGEPCRAAKGTVGDGRTRAASRPPVASWRADRRLARRSTRSRWRSGSDGQLDQLGPIVALPNAPDPGAGPLAASRRAGGRDPWPGSSHEHAPARRRPRRIATGRPARAPEWRAARRGSSWAGCRTSRPGRVA